MNRELQEDKILELSLWSLSLIVFFACYFIQIDAWSDFYIFYVFCGFFFYTTLFKVLFKRLKRKVDYIRPLINLYISTPGGWALDSIVKIIVHITVEDSAEFVVMLLFFLFCLVVVVLIISMILLWLIFWEELKNKK